MKIRSKEQFIELLISTMALMGDIIDNFDFHQDIFDIMTDRRFSSLFYFFNNLEDLDFRSILNKLVEEELIYYRLQEDGTIVIKILNKMFQGWALSTLQKFNQETINLMKLFLRENALSMSLTRILPKDVKGKYSLINPNGIFNIGTDHRLISNGNLRELENGFILVENASFTVIEKLKDERVTSFELLYPFEDENYIYKIVQSIIDMDIPIGYHEQIYRPDLVKEREKFEELKRARVYKYHVL